MKGQYIFQSWVKQATCFGRVQKHFEGLPNPDLTPQKFVRGCLTSTHANFSKIIRLIMMGWQPMMHPLASI
jgi:hypothetical protein